MPETELACVCLVDFVPGIALLNFEEDGTIEYSGETKMCWDGQTMEEVEQGRQMLICPELRGMNGLPKSALVTVDSHGFAAGRTATRATRKPTPKEE